MLAPVSMTSEQTWAHALDAMFADLEAGAYERVVPERFPLSVGPVPPTLAPRLAELLARVNEAIATVTSEMGAIEDELRSNATRGSRRWTASTPQPSRLDFSA